MAGRLLTRDDVDEEIKHVRLGQRGSDVGPLKGASFVLLSVDPSTHGELGDEDVAAFGEEYGRLRRNHLDLWVGLHDLLDARERELVLFIVVIGSLELGDLLLPIGVEDVTIVAREPLVNLNE